METSFSSCGHICTDFGIPIAGEVEEKGELKNLLKLGEFSFYIMVDREIFTYLENKKYSGISIRRTHHKADISIRRTVNLRTERFPGQTLMRKSL